MVIGNVARVVAKSPYLRIFLTKLAEHIVRIQAKKVRTQVENAYAAYKRAAREKDAKKRKVELDAIRGQAAQMNAEERLKLLELIKQEPSGPIRDKAIETLIAMIEEDRA